MKRFFKWLGIVVGVLALLVGVLLLYIQFGYHPTYEVHVPDVHVEATEARLVRGRKLVLSLCAECHRDPLTRQLTGRNLGDLPPIFGTAFSRNITKDPVYGIGAWKDGEIIWLLRTGIHPKTHQYIPPWMIKLNSIADEDLYSIVAFLRSDDELVQPAQVQNRVSEASLFAKVLTFAGAFAPLPYPSGTITRPDTNNAVAYGEYLANRTFGCFDCHSKDFASNDRINPEKSVGFYGGGNMMPDYEHLKVFTANISPDSTYGIGSWSEDTFVHTLQSGFKPNGHLLRYPMVRLSHLSEHELRCMYRYLRTVPAQHSAVPMAEESKVPDGASKGEAVYRNAGCIYCHGPSGLAYADLQLAYKKYPTDDLIITYLKNPDAVYPGTVMPHWDGHLSDQDFSNLAQYVRSLGEKSAR